MDVPSTLGLRARNKAAKRAAISRAAAELFAAHGYAGTTTQQVARVADVAEGTVFRYASSKPELLLMVINEHLRPLVESASDLPDEAVPDEAVLGILDPIIDLAHDQPDNAAPFLREVLFGEETTSERAPAPVDDPGAATDALVADLARRLRAAGANKISRAVEPGRPFTTEKH